MSRSSIKFIQFSILSADQIRAQGIHIKKHHVKDKDKNDPTDTPYDLRLGVLENRAVCPVCGYRNSSNGVSCPGHFGYIELEEVCWNIKFIGMCTCLLKCICLNCSSLRVKKDELTSILKKPDGKHRLEDLKKVCSKERICWNCNYILPKISHTKDDKRIYYTAPDGNKLQISAAACHEIFSKIADDDLPYMGMNVGLSPNPIFIVNGRHLHAIRPESLLFTALPVLPTPARPWVMGKERNDDDLTQRYNDILRVNEQLERLRKPPQETGKLNSKASSKKKPPTREKLAAKLQDHVIALISNKDMSEGGRKRKGICQRVEKKDGHINKNAAGKRVDQSGRSVIISGGYTLPPGYVGVPEYIANRLTVEVKVTPHNIEYLEKLLYMGKVPDVIRDGNRAGVRVHLRKLGDFIFMGTRGLKVGDTVFRCLETGDYCIMNRQPSLRVESMQGYRVLVNKGEFAFRLPLYPTRPFNADFDGDEMNLHLPQTLEAQVEASTVMNVAYNIVSGQHNAAVMGCVQNTRVFMYLVTNYFKGTGTKYTQSKLEYYDLFDIVVALDISPERLQSFYNRAVKYYPDNFYKDPTGKVLLKKKKIPGRLLVSIAFPETLKWQRCTETNPEYPVVNISHGILHPEGGPLCGKVIGGGNSVVLMIWKYYSPQRALLFLSEMERICGHLITRVGFSVGPSDCIVSKDASKVVKDKIKELEVKCAVITASQKPEEDKEKETNGILNGALGFAKEFTKKHTPKGDMNSLVIMKLSGSKGSDTNHNQIAAYVGQQSFSGKRAPKALSFGQRTLTHYKKGDNSPVARGFVSANYIDGLPPSQTFAHACSGRQGIISTGIKTAETGYSQKKIAKKEEDLVAYNDGSIRDANGRIVQYLYGGDGMNPKYLVNIGKKRPFFVDLKILAGIINTEAELAEGKESLGEKRTMNQEEVDELMKFFSISPFLRAGESTSITNDVVEMMLYNTRKILLEMLENTYIYPSKIGELCKRIFQHHRYALVPEGFPAGLTSSSSVGEPSTQMTLNVFHNAGNAEKDVTLGVPRWKEMLAFTKKPANTSVTVYLEKSPKDDSTESLLKVSAIADGFKWLTLNNLVKKYTLMYVPKKDGSVPPASPIGFVKYSSYEKEWWYSEDVKRRGLEVPKGNWVVRLEMNLKDVVKYLYPVHGIRSLYFLAEVIEQNSDGVLVCVCSPLRLGVIDIFANYQEIASYISSKLESSTSSRTSKKEGANPKDLQDKHEKGTSSGRNSKTRSRLESKPEFKNYKGKLEDFFLARDLIIPTIEEYYVQGVVGVTKVYLKFADSSKEWIIDCQVGKIKKKDIPYTPLAHILSLEGVDVKRTTSDNIWELYELFGIEAARKFIVKEYTKILSFDGNYIDPRHIELLADRATYTGTITSVSRIGISGDSGPIAKCMFETAGAVLASAAAHTERDNMKGVAAAIFFGAPMNMGTGLIDVQEDRDY